MIIDGWTADNLISRAAMKDAMSFIDQTSITYEEMVDRFKKEVDNAPTVTPSEIQAIMSDYLIYKSEPKRPKGEWVDEGQYAEGHSEHAYICKSCGYQIIEKPNTIFENRFCKCCGADMRGEEE